MSDEQLSERIERLLVMRNPRQMQVARAALTPGYVMRAATLLRDLRGHVIIGTGFPVTGTFETDGPVGAIALYRSLETLGATPIIACGSVLADALKHEYRVLQLTARDLPSAELEAAARLQELQATAIVSIERPGLAADGHYYNMRGVNISGRCFYFDTFITQAKCPTIGIGDGGNEIGMGNIAAALASFNITASVTRCDELLVADVSNWGAYGLIALLGYWAKRDLLQEIAPLKILNYLSTLGSVDGVTGANTLTEDGLPATEGLQVILALRELTNFVSD